MLVAFNSSYRSWVSRSWVSRSWVPFKQKERRMAGQRSKILQDGCRLHVFRSLQLCDAADLHIINTPNAGLVSVKETEHNLVKDSIWRLTFALSVRFTACARSTGAFPRSSSKRFPICFKPSTRRSIISISGSPSTLSLALKRTPTATTSWL